MMMRTSTIATKRLFTAVALLALSANAGAAQERQPYSVTEPTPLAIGETFALRSDVLDETRTINVYVARAWGDTTNSPLPVLYMPDGGTGEDFVHVAGLLQVSVMNGTMRPFMLVGIENTERRRDLTGFTRVAKDSTIAPRVGGSSAFRTFIRTELKPAIEARYATTSESAIVGESLAGLFVVETFLHEPELFDTYVAIDPSLWWNDAGLLDDVDTRLSARPYTGKTLWVANSSEPELARLAATFMQRVTSAAPAGLTVHHQAMPDETHGTIYHPAALRAFRTVFRPGD